MPLNNRVRVFFPTSIYGPNAKQDGHELKCKNLGALTYRKQRENEFSKMFIITCRHTLESSWKDPTKSIGPSFRMLLINNVINR